MSKSPTTPAPHPQHTPRRPALLAAGLLGLLTALAGCTTAPAGKTAAPPMATADPTASAPRAGPLPAGAVAAAAAASAAASAAGAAATGPASAPAAGGPPPFALVIKDAKATAGLITLWRKDEKVWLELRPEDFDKPFFLSPKIAQGIGEPGFYSGTLVGHGGRSGRAQLFEFRRVHGQVQMLAINANRVARDAQSPAGRSVAAGFSPSLLASSLVASQPHPERKSVLVEAAPLFLSDMLGLGPALQRSYRQGYALDGRHTQFSALRGTPEGVVLEVNAHFYAASLAGAQAGAPPGSPMPLLPAALPDARSLFLGLHYAIARLPELPMAPRAADSRVGYFQTAVDDFSDDLARSPRRHFVNRWRLDKREPQAEWSEPVKPISFWIDRTVPLKYRDTVQRAILAWNEPFEKIGFRNAIVARVAPDSGEVDTLGLGIAAVRWISNAQSGFIGSGPSQVDPRSGEILVADILIDGNWARGRRDLRSRVLTGDNALGTTATDRPDAADAAGRLPPDHATLAQGAVCEEGPHAAEQLAYALDVLATRSALAADSPEAERFAQEAVFAVVVHEVGHALGLRHNFRASRAYSLAQLADPAFTAEHGLAASVMDYADINLPPPGVPFERHGAPFPTRLGPYDFWAIEHGYRPLAAADEARELQRIAARSAEPGLGYGTDEDAWLGFDAESLLWDLGDDPVAYARSRMAIATDLIARQETRRLAPDEDYAVLRRAIGFAVADVSGAAAVLTRQVGGLRTLRDRPGSGREPMQPLPAAAQRAALALLVEQVLSGRHLQLSAALQRRLAPDYQARADALEAGANTVATDYSFSSVLLQLQRTVLAQLMSDGLAVRLLDNQDKTERGADLLRLPELYDRIARAVWQELGSAAAAADIAPARRELQREHVNRLAGLLLRPAALNRADARSLLREQARQLLPRLQAAARRAPPNAETRAHLRDAADTLAQSLAAPLQRQGT